MRLSSGKSSINGGGTSDSGDMKVDSTRRSEQLGKQTPPKAPQVPRKSTRLEQQSTPSPVRRSGRIQTQGSSAEKASSPSNSHNKKGLKEKSVEQLTTESAEVSPSDTDNSTKRKILNARNYKALFKKQKKLKGGEGKFEQGNQVDSLDNSVSISQPLEHREIEPPLEHVEPEIAYPDQSFLDKPSGSSDVDGSLIGCTNTETVDDVIESPKDCSRKLPLSRSKSSTSKQKGDVFLESGEQVTQLESESCALPLEVDSSRIVANKESFTLALEAVASASASTEHEKDKSNGFGADCLNSNLVKKKESSVAHGSKTDPSKFVEYWVPVPVSNVQLEHYCATLVANTITLSSPLKKDVFGVLPNILNTVHKCCDHPYLVDRSIQPSILKEFTPNDILNVGIKASGKLQLLDMILSKCRRPNLKVLILYQSFAGSGGIGDILDDYMRQKFGENSYGRLESNLIPSKRQETLNKFNDKGGEPFVLLLEHRACSSSVKLLLVDFVIIFNTELSRPANEVKDLQRMSIAQSKQIKIFRLYSCHTLEEKVLILAKHHKSVNVLQNTNRTMSDSLLMWGASVLFNRLGKFHAEQSTGFSLDCLSGQQSLLNDIVMSFMDKIMNEPEDNCEHGSIISRAFFNEGVYHMDKLLLGEKDVQLTDGVDHQLFWKELLEGRKPWWKFWGPTSRSRKRGTYDENSETTTKHQKVVDTRVIVSDFHLAVESGGQDAVPKADSDQPASESEQTSLHEFLKDEMKKLCLVLQLSMDIKQMVGAFLEYVIKNHHVSKEPASILHAFQISLCWAAAKILKKSMYKRETLVQAKNALQFQCTDEEAYSVYEKLRALKKTFQQLRRKNSVSLPSQNVSAAQGIRKQTLYEGHPQSAALEVQNVKVEDEEGSSSLGLSEELTADELNGSFPDKKIKTLEKQHEKEILDFHKTKEQEKSRLESDHQIESAFIRKTYPENGTARSMLMQLENELKKNIQEHEDSIKVQFEGLQTRHSAEKKKMVDEWRTKEMSRARSNAEKEVPSASHNIEKQNPNNVVRDNGTEKLKTSGVSVIVADNTLDSAARSETSLHTPANRVPDELLRIERAGAEPAIVVEQPEETSQRSPQIQTIELEAGGSGVPRGAEPLTAMEQPGETNQISHQIPADCAGGSESSLCTPEDEVLGVERAGVTVVQPEEACQVSPHTAIANAQMVVGSVSCPDKVLEIEHTRVEPVKVVEQSKESSSQNNGPSAVPGTGGSEVGDATSERKNSLEVETEDDGENPVGSHGTGNQSNEPSSVPGPSRSESGNACFSEIETSPQAETGNNPMGSDASGDQNVPPPHPLTEDIISLPIVPTSELPQKNVHEKTGTQAFGCNKLSVATVNHMHIERTNSLPPTPAASVQMIEGSMELPHQAVSQDENTMGMSSVEDMGASNLCSHQVNGRFASPTSAPSQVVEESMDLSHQETMGQPPSREIVEPTHCDTQFDLEIGTGANDGPSVELPAASQNGLAPIPQVESLTRPPNQFVAQSDLHVHPMHHIGFRNSTLALHPQSLLSELDTIQKMREQIVKLHDGKEALLNSEYERKQEELRMEHQEKLKEAKSARMRELAQVERNYKVASMHTTLSEALQFKCSDGRTPGNSSMQQGLAAAVPPHFMQQMHQAGLQPRLRHPSAAALSSTSHPTAGQHNSFSPVQSHHRSSTFFSTSRPTMSLQNIANPPIQSHHRSSGPFASARPPQISSITPSVGSPRVGGEIRAPAPHLQPYRPPASSAPRLPSNILIPTQLMTAPSLSSPSVPAYQHSQISLRPNLPSQSPSMLHLSSLNQDVGSSQLSEMQDGVARTRLNLSFSAMDLLMANGDKTPLGNFAGSASSANASSDPSASRVPRDVNEGMPTSDTAASDVVLLSDDES